MKRDARWRAALPCTSSTAFRTPQRSENKGKGAPTALWSRCGARQALKFVPAAARCEPHGGGCVEPDGEIQKNENKPLLGVWACVLAKRGHGRCLGSYRGSQLRPKHKIPEKTGFAPRLGVLRSSDLWLKKRDVTDVWDHLVSVRESGSGLSARQARKRCGLRLGRERAGPAKKELGRWGEEWDPAQERRRGGAARAWEGKLGCGEREARPLVLIPGRGEGFPFFFLNSFPSSHFQNHLKYVWNIFELWSNHSAQ